MNETLDNLLNVSTDAAKNLVPDIFLKFSCQILSDRSIKLENDKIICDSVIKDKALILSQQLLFSICGVKTPLAVGAAFEVYNSSRSKTQITMLNKLNHSNDTFHRQLTTVYNDIINKVQEKGQYIPPNIKPGLFTQFAMDNIDWHEKTLDGSTFHATSCIIIQPPTDDKIVE